MSDLRAFREYVRQVIKEEIGRDYKSVETMPMNYLRYPELSVSVDYITEKGKWMVGIKRREDEKKKYKYFNSREEAETWARTRADQLRNAAMNDPGYAASHITRLVR